MDAPLPPNPVQCALIGQAPQVVGHTLVDSVISWIKQHLEALTGAHGSSVWPLHFTAITSALHLLDGFFGRTGSAHQQVISSAGKPKNKKQ